MGSCIDSSRPAIRDSTCGGAPLLPFRIEPPEATLTGRYVPVEEFGVPAFASPEGCYRKDIKELWPAVADEHGNHHVLIAQDFLQRPPAPRQAPLPNEIDARYAAEFERLELAMEANVKRPQAVPSSVTGRRSVATLGVVGMAAGGEAVFGSVLEEHVVTDQAK